MGSSTDSMVVIPIVLSILCVAASYFASSAWTIWQNHSTAKRLGCRPPPKFPSRWPRGIGFVLEFLAAGRDMRLPEYFKTRLRSFGDNVTTCTLRTGLTAAVFTCDEENIQAVLAENFEDFEIGQFRRGAMSPLLGNGISTQDGSEWRHSRAMLHRSLSRQQVSPLEFEDRHLDNLIKYLPTNPSSWTDEVDIQKLFCRFTLDSTSEYLFGRAVGSQLQHLRRNETDEHDGFGGIDFTTAFERSVEAIGSRLAYLDFGAYVWPAGFDQACLDCHRFVDDYIQEQFDHLGSTSDAAETVDRNKYLVFDTLAAEVKDPVELRSQLLNVLHAGRDTTAGLLGWVFYSLARDPDRYQKLRDSVIKDLGSYQEKDSLAFDHLGSCRYLQYVIDETLRLYPIVPLNRRTAIRNTLLPRGGGPDGKSKIFISKGSHVWYSVYAMHRRTSIWGPDADEFVPERWEGRRVGWEYLPFNGGPRSCLGQQFALTTAAYVIARLVQRFDKIENLDPKPVKYRVRASMLSGEGVKVRFHEAA